MYVNTYLAPLAEPLTSGNPISHIHYICVVYIHIYLYIHIYHIEIYRYIYMDMYPYMYVSTNLAPLAEPLPFRNKLQRRREATLVVGCVHL